MVTPNRPEDKEYAEQKAQEIYDFVWARHREFHFTGYAADPDEATQAFIDFMMSDEVQGSLVSENGYISVSGMKVSRDADGNVTKL